MEPSVAADGAGTAPGTRKLIAIMHADVVGYSRLIGRDDSGTLERLRALRRDLIDPAIAEFGGRLVQTAGDSWLLVFDSIDGALRCAMAVQQGIPCLEGNGSGEQSIRLRIGVNVGDVIPDRGDLHGDGVNITARLQEICPPGAICVTRVVRDHVQDRLHLRFERLGKLRLKNISRPVEAFVLRLDPASTAAPPRRAVKRRKQFGVAGAATLAFVVIGGSAMSWLWHRMPDSGAPPAAASPAPASTTAASTPAAPVNGLARAGPLSIVVLPFVNLSGDPEQQYFADAITNDLTTDLSRISGSLVIAYRTAQTYQGKPVDVRQIGHDLDVSYVLEGSIRRMGDDVEVNAQLIEAERGAHVWAERFATDRRDLAKAQTEITGRLARTLGLELTEAAGRRIEQDRAADPNASDLVMRGWALWIKPFSVENRRAARQAFERALQVDPGSVNAKIGLATLLVTSIGTGTSQFPEQDSARAEQLLREAIEQDGNSSLAHDALGTLRRIQTRLDDARIEYETAISLDRNNAEALLGLGQILMFQGHPADAIGKIESSLRLDPRDPNIAFLHWSLGACHLLLGHVDEAADLLRRARAENPRVYFFLIYLAGALGVRGDIDQARAALAEAIRLKPDVNSLAGWTAAQPWISNPAFVALRANTLDVGLRRAGMPDR